VRTSEIRTAAAHDASLIIDGKVTLGWYKVMQRPSQVVARQRRRPSDDSERLE
jgi:hypothetical protein